MKTLLATFLAALFLFAANNSHAQIKKLIQKKTDEILNKPIEKPKEEKPKAENPKESKPAPDTAAKQAQPASQESMQVYSKFDFIPGEKVIFFEDFNETNQGDFPLGWNTNGSAEVVTTSQFPGKWIKPAVDGRASVFTDKAIELPENYTIEFDVIPQQRRDKSLNFTFRLLASQKPQDFDNGSIPGKAGLAVSFEYNIYFSAYYSDGRNKLSNLRENMRMKENEKYHIACWIQKERIRVYQNEVKLFDLPKAMDPAVKYNRIRFDDGSPLITNIRIATGLPDTRSKLITEGKL
jgi:hypothetical protein